MRNSRTEFHAVSDNIQFKDPARSLEIFPTLPTHPQLGTVDLKPYRAAPFAICHPREFRCGGGVINSYSSFMTGVACFTMHVRETSASKGLLMFLYVVIIKPTARRVGIRSTRNPAYAFYCTCLVS